jgi:hypothetical protein
MRLFITDICAVVPLLTASTLFLVAVSTFQQEEEHRTYHFYIYCLEAATGDRRSEMLLASVFPNTGNPIMNHACSMKTIK